MEKAKTVTNCYSNPSSINKTVPKNDMVCYCFQHTTQNIVVDFQKHGESTIEKDVRQKVKDKLCSCETKNPKGSCCLGDIRKVIKGVENYG